MAPLILLTLLIYRENYANTPLTDIGTEYFAHMEMIGTKFEKRSFGGVLLDIKQYMINIFPS